ncbi:MAG: hypothetical protein IKF38_01955 [Clostridia bacterium]|nr:hypothetical protein [Clostridia bacterium]
MANYKGKQDKIITEKIVIEPKYTNEITPIQAVLPIVLEEINKKRMQYLKEQEDKK